MKPVTAYKSFDGRIFEVAKECADYEAHCYNLSKILSGLPKFDKTNGYMTGKEYYQHRDPLRWIEIRNQLLLYLDTRYPAKHFKGLVENNPDKAVLYDYKVMETFLRKHCDMPSLVAWQELGYVDEQFRQWSRPIFFTKTDAIPINIQYKEKTINLDTSGLEECDIPGIK